MIFMHAYCSTHLQGWTLISCTLPPDHILDDDDDMDRVLIGMTTQILGMVVVHLQALASQGPRLG